MVVSFSQVGLAFHFFFLLFFSFFIYVCCRYATLSHSVAKKKHPFNAWNTLSPELLELVGSRRTFFFVFWPILFFYICLLQKCNNIPQCCKEKHPFNAWNTLSPELLELVGACFFFGPNYFFFTYPRSFWSFDVTRNKENNNSGLNTNSKFGSVKQNHDCKYNKV